MEKEATLPSDGILASSPIVSVFDFRFESSCHTPKEMQKGPNHTGVKQKMMVTKEYSL